jgi:hypothetical protein
LFFYNKKNILFGIFQLKNVHMCDTLARAFTQGTKAHNDYNGRSCPRWIEEGEFIDNMMTFPDVACASRTTAIN